MCNLIARVLSLLLIIPAIGLAQVSTRPSTQFVAIVSSFPEELDAIEKLLLLRPTDVKTQQINGVNFRTATVAHQDCIFFETGMSLVNAAMNTQLALDHFTVSSVLFTGIAGGVDPSLHPGDVVIPQRWHYHSESAYFNETAAGKFALADYFKPKYKNFGMIFPEDVTVRRGGDTWHQQASFDADEQLLTLARQASKSLPALTFGDRACQTVIGGDGVSGTVFCDNAEYRKFVFDVWKAQCLDMESTAIAQVCWQNRKPCLIVRGLSDLAGGQAGKNTVDEYLKAAADHSAEVVAAIVRQLSR